MHTIKRIAIIGSGNAGQYFLNHLKVNGVTIKGFARKNSTYFADLRDFESQNDFDLTLLCVSDDAIGEVSTRLAPVNGILAHISGSQSLDVLDPKHARTAVFYPLMSLTLQSPPNISQIPFCIEALNQDTRLSLSHFAKSLGATPYLMDDKKRGHVHLAAVLSQNFSNHLFAKAKEILESQEIDFELLMPILQQSIERLKFSDPHDVQTGPAARKDVNTMKKHLELIKDDDLKRLYQALSKSIQKDHEQKL